MSARNCRSSWQLSDVYWSCIFKLLIQAKLPLDLGIELVKVGKINSDAISVFSFFSFTKCVAYGHKFAWISIYVFV